MMHHYPDLGSASDWLKQISHTAQPIRGTTKKWLVTCHQYRISALVFQTSFHRETVGEITKCWLFSRGTLHFWLKKLILFNVNLILIFCTCNKCNGGDDRLIDMIHCYYYNIMMMIVVVVLVIQ